MQIGWPPVVISQPTIVPLLLSRPPVLCTCKRSAAATTTAVVIQIRTFAVGWVVDGWMDLQRRVYKGVQQINSIFRAHLNNNILI